jgi:histidine triad (HIT) family protein
MADMPCVFCQIIAEELPSLPIYGDQHTLAIMDQRQPGWPDVAHVLVLPREHVETLDRLSDRTSAALIGTTVKVSQALRQILQPEGYNLWQSNGEVAGQEVPHVHFHLLTRSRGDGLFQIYEVAPDMPLLEDMAGLADRLRSQLDALDTQG